MMSARLLSVYFMMALMAVCSYALQGINEEVEKEISDMGLRNRHFGSSVIDSSPTK
ncbi:hypothetical protein KIN20_030842 [Parelaphostrongylus tenuis]|uniref:Uncharacterized protein n=1 Tax=Parelaphostrongylus tenuis TaxID=148309 RepID=A0AAD5R4C6_PARTN|nr:hypothetical protein KIN20_030842 [Parelaphostrongylus tenuis]